VLAATGRLADTVGGPSMDPDDPRQRRRTVYSRVSRLSLNPLLALFDFPDPNIHADRRVETTTPLQKLFVMNNPFMLREAEAFAARVSTDIGAASRQMDEEFIQRAYQILHGRPAGDAEIRLGLEFFKTSDSMERRTQYAQVLLASNEMLFID